MKNDNLLDYQPEQIKLQRNGTLVAYGLSNKSPYRGEFKKENPFIDNYPSKARRKITNAVVYMAYNQTARAVPMVFTTPVRTPIREANLYLSNILNRLRNLSKEKKLNQYVWIAEHGEKTNRLHYHALLDIPFYDIQKLSKDWSNQFESNSKNSVRLHDEEKRLLKSGNLAYYFGKYASKQYKVRAKANYNLSKKCDKMSNRAITLATENFKTHFYDVSQNITKEPHEILLEYPYPDFIKEVKFQKFNEWVQLGYAKNLDKVNSFFTANI